MAEKTIDALANNPALQEKRKEMLENMKPYTVVSGDTVASIAHKYGLEDYHDLVTINRLMGNTLKARGKSESNILIHAGDTVYVPKNIERFRAEIESVKKISEALAQNEMVAKGDREGLKKEINERIFPSVPESVGTAKLLQGFTKAQEASVDPILPRIVDVRYTVSPDAQEPSHATCANLVRKLLFQSLNVRDMKPEERKFFRKQNVDAWMLPGELKKIGFTQAVSLMGTFDPKKVGNRDPIDSDKRAEYTEWVANMGKYLEEQGVPGSLVPIYFRASDYKDDVAAYNQGRTDKHYNTHQSLYAGPSTMKFTAREMCGAQKEDTLMDCLLNFLQRRGDLPSSITPEGRERFRRGVQKYASLIHIKINGQESDILKDGRKKVQPEDMVEISGPMMIDGLHMANSDPDRKKNMNARTRFFFEFAASDMFLPTEILEPGKDSTFRKEAFDRPTDSLSVKWTYDLRRNMTLEKVLKKQIPLFEKEAFAKLDQNADDYHIAYEALIQKYYGLQIKALQMMGIIEDENHLNPGGTNINRTISYFDTANIPEIYSTYIQSVKTKRLADNEEIAPYKEYLDVQLLPGDTYMNLFARIAKNLENYGSHFDTYPNLRYIGRLSEPLRREFLEQYINSAIKSDKSATWEKLLVGKVKPGTKFILPLVQADKIAEWLQRVSYTGNVDNQLRNLDKEVVDFMVPLEQSRDIVKTSMMIESYDRPNSNWFKPVGIRKFGKKMLEKHPSLRTFHALNSVGDFQIRIQDLKNGWNEEWPNRKQVEYAIARLKNPSIEKRIESLSQVSSSNKSIIEQDRSIVRRIELILSKTELEPRDFETLTNDLIRLARIDDGTGSNIIGKSIGASLDADSFGLNFQKVWWMLERSGEDMEMLRNDKKKSRVYGQAVLLAHNLSEKKVLLGFTENYIMRLLEKINSANGKNAALQYPELQTTALSGSIHYGLNTFVRHIQSILGSQELASRWGSPEEQVIFATLHAFHAQITEIAQKPEEECGKGVINAVYSLLSNKDLRSALERYPYDPTDPKKRISASLLPNPEEFSGNGFRNVFFNYIRKGEEIERRATEKEEVMAKDGREEDIASR